MKAMSIVVLGGSGFVGSHLLPRLARDGHSLRLLTRNRNLHMQAKVLPDIEILETDVYDRERLIECFQGADAVINLVGILNERGFSGQGFERAHVELTETVIAACTQARVSRLLQMSSLNAGQGESHYLKSRGRAEARVRDSGLAWTIFQPSVIFGPGDGIYTRFATLGKLAITGLPLARAGSKLAPVYVGDVCEAMAQSLQRAETIGRTYQLYGPEVFTLEQIVRYALQVAGHRRPVFRLPDVLGRLQAAVFDFVPGKPFSSDNYKSLLLDSVGTLDGLGELGIARTRVEDIVPGYLGRNARQRRYDRYRAGS